MGLSISSESVVTLAVGWEDGDFSGEPFWIFGLRHHEGDIEGISVSLRLPKLLAFVNRSPTSSIKGTRTSTESSPDWPLLCPNILCLCRFGLHSRSRTPHLSPRA